MGGLWVVPDEPLLVASIPLARRIVAWGVVGRRVARIEILFWRSPPPLSNPSVVAGALVLFILLIVSKAAIPFLTLRVVACKAAAEVPGVRCTLMSLLAAPVALLAHGGGVAEHLALHAAAQLVELLEAPVQLLLLLLPELLLLLPEVTEGWRNGWCSSWALLW